MRIRAATEADYAAIAKVHVDSWRTTYSGILPQEYLDQLSCQQREQMWRDILSTPGPAFTLLVQEAGGEVVGFASGGLERTGDPLFRGDLLAIYLLQAYQGKGLGRLLIRAVVERLLGQGIGSLLVWVLAQNPSRRFYERLGAERVKERSIVLGGADLVEVAYGWRDAGVLLQP